MTGNSIGKRWTMMGLLVTGVALGGCGGGDVPGDEAAEAAANTVADAFQAEQQRWREQRAARLTAADGWTTLVGLHWLEPGPHYMGSDADNGIRLAVGPAHMGMIELKSGQIRFVPEKGTALTLDGEPLTAPATLRADDDAAGPSVIGFDEGRGLLTVLSRGDRHALRVKHADAPTRTGFKGIEYWPADSGWRIQGRFVAHPRGKTLPIANIVGTTDEVSNPGVVEFERDGQTYRLEALDEGDEQLFLVFADRTSGHGSYGAGRFLYAPKPDVQGRVLLDFNQAYNPPCAFTAFATCPLPPLENRLDLAITAGEKAYSFSAK
ncbi:DUF1684 domain-containing protein [Marilutibacter chinensis]|uniref:DUF1684 domain-containing protein n=1 Tax=Marilutibacter chinensis TaxID=2912247 RepID=A0ABS9HPN2_9GAMM|nr:DUF1684 domain-containing protein [Lysobacter chinensis]MCF7220906.1 DUF1684 domain-containing protein [Lysobacter chinensis]